MDRKALSKFHGSLSQVDFVLDHNRVLIDEINRNQEAKVPERLTRNVSLITELNQNIKRVVDLYSGISSSFASTFQSVAGPRGGEGDGEGEGDGDGDEDEEEQEEEEAPREDREETSTYTVPVGSSLPEESRGSSDSSKRKRLS